MQSNDCAMLGTAQCCQVFFDELATGTADTDHALFEEILVECTAFQLAGALNEEAIREAVDFVTNALLRDGDSPRSPSPPVTSSALTEAAVAQVSHSCATLPFEPAATAHC